MYGIIKTTAEQGTDVYPEETVRSCIAACYFALLWDLKAIQEKGETGITGGDDVPKLHRKLNDYMMSMRYLVNQKTVQAFREEAYTSICDGLIVFCYQ